MRIFMTLSFIFLLFGCGEDGNSVDTAADASDDASVPGDAGAVDTEPPPPTSLAAKYADYFPIGAAVDSQSYRTHESLLIEHFNSITAENEMKFESLQWSDGKFFYTDADRLVNFAQEHGMLVRGHALVWHRQTPDWVFQDAEGNPASPELLLERLESHISNVMAHFKGKVYAWDVVNEAMMNDGSLRTGEELQPDHQSRWYAILGDSYIPAAFRFAAAADPDAKLFYNDYYNYLPAKRDAIYNMLAGLIADGVPVHGVGLQCHLKIEPSTDPENQSLYQTVEDLEAAIELYASLGIEVHITELDVSLYLSGGGYGPEAHYTEETFTSELQNEQAERYRSFFDMWRRHKDVITSVTLWGVADDSTWLSEFDSGRTDFPLLFDVNHQPKPAFYAVMDF